MGVSGDPRENSLSAARMFSTDRVEIRKGDERVISEILALRGLQNLLSQLCLDLLVLAEETECDGEGVRCRVHTREDERTGSWRGAGRGPSAFLNYGHIRQQCLVEVITRRCAPASAA